MEVMAMPVGSYNSAAQPPKDCKVDPRSLAKRLRSLSSLHIFQDSNSQKEKGSEEVSIHKCCLEDFGAFCIFLNPI